jgi:hypothetical protein
MKWEEGIGIGIGIGIRMVLKRPDREVQSQVPDRGESCF